MPPGFQEWAESVSLWQAVGWTGGIVAFIVGGRLFVKKGWPALKRFAQAILTFAHVVDAVQGLPDFIDRTDATLEAQDAKIADIHHEVHFNNGSSVKDAVTRIEADVIVLKDQLVGDDTNGGTE